MSRVSEGFHSPLLYHNGINHRFKSQQRIQSISELWMTTTGNEKEKTKINRHSAILHMVDHSCVNWFAVGDCVKVNDDVIKAGINLKDRVGTVIETWEKCEVDPTCCCAEQVDTGMAVRVRFEDVDSKVTMSLARNKQNNRNMKNENDEGSPLFVETFFTHYFAEEELIKIKPDKKNDSKNANIDNDSNDIADKFEKETLSNEQIPFDGLSCKEFKLKNIGQSKPRRIASYEPGRLEE